MQYFRPGSQLRQLITMLSIVGEYPIRSLYLLGNERAYKALVHKLRRKHSASLRRKRK